MRKNVKKKSARMMLKKCFKILFVMLGMVVSSAEAFAAPILITGNVKNQAISQADHHVSVHFAGIDTNTITDQYGNYSIVIDPHLNSGIIEVRSINCIGDTISKSSFFSQNQSQLLVNFEMCENNYSLFIRGNVFYKHEKAPMVKVEFSLNDFKSILEFVHTDSKGEYGIKLFTGPNATGKISARITSYDGTMFVNSAEYYEQDTVVVDLVKRKAPNHSLVAGQVKRGQNFAFNNEMDLYLYGLDPNDQQIKLMDSTRTSTGGAYHFFINDTLNYLVKAVPTSTQPYLLPAYSNGSLFWNDDEVLYVKNLSGFVSQDIDLNLQLNDRGTNTITGSVKYDGGELSLKKHPVLLLNDQQIAESCTFLKGDGTYEFNNVPEGSFYVWIDDPGKETKPVSVFIDSDNKTVEAEVLVVNSFRIGPEEALQIENVDLQNGLSIYPNPFVDELRVHIKGGESLTVQVFSISGKLVIDQAIQSGGSISTSHLKPGVYITKVDAGNNSLIQKMIKR